ncbi:MAG TPA: DUF5606 domain-containing protein [Flavobacteriaceae bacterium]|nr:DUF5606 domain-containing protein [Flavobacteriaceae bacterium]
MSLNKILAISSKPGLYKLKAQTRSGFVAQSLENGRKIPVNLQHDVSMLSEITVYTEEDEVPLAEIFEKIYAKEEGKKSINHKKPKEELVAHFEEIIPEYNEDRVYTSDIKKIFQWYNILIDNGFKSFSEEEEENKSDEEE